MNFFVCSLTQNSIHLDRAIVHGPCIPEYSTYVHVCSSTYSAQVLTVNKPERSTTMNVWAQILGAAAFATTACVGAAGAAPASASETQSSVENSNKPNIVYIMTDGKPGARTNVGVAIVRQIWPMCYSSLLCNAKRADADLHTNDSLHPSCWYLPGYIVRFRPRCRAGGSHPHDADPAAFG